MDEDKGKTIAENDAPVEVTGAPDLASVVLPPDEPPQDTNGQSGEEQQGEEQQSGGEDVKFDEKTRQALEAKDRELYQQKMQLRQQQAELERWQRIQAQRAEDPLGVMKELGIDRMTLADQLIAPPKQEMSPSEQKMAERIAQLEKRLENNENQMVVRDEKSQLASAIRSNSDLVALNEFAHDNPHLVDSIYEDISRQKQEGKRIDYGEILRNHNNKIEDDIIQNLPRMLKSARFKEALAGMLNKEPQKAADQRVPPQYKAPQRTLTNDLQGDPPRTIPQAKTADEAMEFLLKQKINFWEPE